MLSVSGMVDINLWIYQIYLAAHRQGMPMDQLLHELKQNKYDSIIFVRDKLVKDNT